MDNPPGQDSEIPEIKSASTDTHPSFLRFLLDHDEVLLLSTAPREELVFESLQGELQITAEWTASSRDSAYRPVDGRLPAKNIVIVPVIDELVEMCQLLDQETDALPQVSLHGTPLELAFTRSDAVLVIRIEEAIGYSDNKRILGTVTISVRQFFRAVSTLIEDLLRAILSGNPALANSPVVESLQRDSAKLARKAA